MTHDHCLFCPEIFWVDQTVRIDRVDHLGENPKGRRRASPWDVGRLDHNPLFFLLLAPLSFDDFCAHGKKAVSKSN